MNILFFGQAGVGKSAFINSLATALSGHFHEYAVAGHHGGDTRPITFHMKRYVNCCLDETYARNYPGVELPTLVDMAGLPNEYMHELIRTIYYGRLPEGFPITEAVDILQRDGNDGLRRRCPITVTGRKIDRILFLSSAMDRALPVELIRCIVDICRPRGVNGRKRAVPLYGVMTKMDKVNVNSEDYLAHERELKDALGITGSSHRFFRCTNYCDDTVPDRCDMNSSDLDKQLLQFFKQLVDPFAQVEFDEEEEDYSHLNKFGYKIKYALEYVVSIPLTVITAVVEGLQSLVQKMRSPARPHSQ